MPFQLDSRIPLAAQNPEPFNGLAQLGQIRAQQQEQQIRQQQIQQNQQRLTQQQTQATTEATEKKTAADLSAKIDGLLGSAFKQDSESGIYTFDRSVVEQGMAQQGMGHLIPAWSEHLDKMDASTAKMAKARNEGVAQALVAVGDFGNTPDAIVSAGAYLLKNGAITKDHLAPILQAAADDPSPENIKGLVTKLGGALPEYRALVQSRAKSTADLAHTKAETDKLTAETAQIGQPKEPASIDAAILQATRAKDPQEVRRLLNLKGQMNAAGRAPTAAAPQEPLVAIMGPDGQAVLVPRSQAAGKRPASTREQGRPVTAGDAGDLSNYQTSLDDLATLRTTLTATKDATGISAAAGAALPSWATNLTGWGTDAKKRQAMIDRIKQVIGKTLEGGVLRKEDEAKYEKILPTIKDPPDVAMTKMDGLEAAITQRNTRRLEALSDAGYDTTKFTARTPGTAKKKVGRFEIEAHD